MWPLAREILSVIFILSVYESGFVVSNYHFRNQLVELYKISYAFFEFNPIASFQIRQITCWIIFLNNQKLRRMAQIFGTKASKKKLQENHSGLWRGSCLLYLPVPYSWLKRFKMCFLCTKKASSFCLLEKKVIDFSHCHLTRKTLCDIFSKPECSSLMELRDSFAASRVFKSFSNWPLFYIRQIIKKNKKKRFLT